MDKKNRKPSLLSELLKNITKKAILDNAEKEKAKAYDIRRIYEQMELDLISSMKRAFYYHQREQENEGFVWEQWQLTKLREFEAYRKRNKAIVEEYNGPIQKAIDRELTSNFFYGENRVKRLINKALNIFNERSQRTNIIVDLPIDISKSISAIAPKENAFFGINEKKLEALISTVKNDLNKAEYSVLRKMDDVYRQTLFKTHVYMQNGTKTLYQAIDMATKDFLDKGINSIEYKNGARVNIASYAEMCLRTASHRATLLGEGKKRDEYGIHLIVVSVHGNTCRMCEPWQGEILIDDIFSHPSKDYIEEHKTKYKLLSEAVEKGLLHPNCRHTLVTYFPGITKLPVVPDGKEAIKIYEAEQKQRALERAIRKAKREEAGTLDYKNQQKARNKVIELEKKLREHLKNNKALRRNYNREKPRPGITNKSLKVHEELLKKNYVNDKIEEIRKFIKSDKQPKTIEIGKQGKHILEHNNYIEGRSYLTISVEEAQELVNKYAGTGYIKLDRKGEWVKKELIEVDKNIGVSINNETGIKTPTNKFKIHYSNKGTHIVPTLKED